MIKFYLILMQLLKLWKGKGNNNSFKGEMIKNIYLTSTMGISYKLKLDKHF